MAETGQLDVCVFLLPAVVANVPFFPFPSFGAVHEVPLLVLAYVEACILVVTTLIFLACISCVAGPWCMCLTLPHLEGIIERRRGLGFATPQSVHGVG